MKKEEIEARINDIYVGLNKKSMDYQQALQDKDKGKNVNRLITSLAIDINNLKTEKTNLEKQLTES